MRLSGCLSVKLFGCRDSVGGQSQTLAISRDRSVTVPADRCSRILTRQRSCVREAVRCGGEPCLSPLRGREAQRCYGNAGLSRRADIRKVVRTGDCDAQTPTSRRWRGRHTAGGAAADMVWLHHDLVFRMDAAMGGRGARNGSCRPSSAPGRLWRAACQASVVPPRVHADVGAASGTRSSPRTAGTAHAVGYVRLA
jgi:hypothetical protein